MQVIASLLVIEGLLALLLCQVVGELAVRTFDLQIPGPVLGMLLLFVVLLVRKPKPDAPVLSSGDRLLDLLPLLFVPAGVGVMTQVELLRREWLPIGASFFLSWAVALLVTAATAALVHRKVSDPTADETRVLVTDAEQMEGLEHDEEGDR